MGEGAECAEIGETPFIDVISFVRESELGDERETMMHWIITIHFFLSSPAQLLNLE